MGEGIGLLMTYEVFTRNLMCLKPYRKMRKELKGELETIFYDMTGVKGVSFGNVPVSFNPSMEAIKKLEMVEKYEDKLREYNFVNLCIQEIEKQLDRMPDNIKAMLTDVYVKNMTFAKASVKYGYSDGGFWNMLKRETEKHL